ncbi:hypothetical protein [Vibrio phage P23]|nr:hypothetical protein [Vibrio phage P23]
MIRKMFYVDNEAVNKLVSSMSIDGLLNELVFLTVAIGDKSINETDLSEMKILRRAIMMK